MHIFYVCHCDQFDITFCIAVFLFLLLLEIQSVPLRHMGSPQYGPVSALDSETLQRMPSKTPVTMNYSITTVVQKSLPTDRLIVICYDYR